MTERIEQLPQRAAVYRLLASLWGSELSKQSVELLASPNFRDVWLSLGGIDPNRLPEDLAEDYCQLFIGPVGHLPPLQSVWTSGELQSDVSTPLTEFSRITSYDSPWPELLPDHLANELQLMAVILEKATLESESVRLDLADNLARTFFCRHLNWPQLLFKRIPAIAPHGFYAGLAALTESYLVAEAVTHGIVSPENDVDNSPRATTKVLR